MGSLAGGRCFPTAVEAAQAECGTYPRTAVDAGQAVTWSCQAVASDGSTLSLSKTDTAGTVLAQTLAVSYEPCDDMAVFNDTATLWAAGISALAAVYVCKAFIYRLVANQ